MLERKWRKKVENYLRMRGVKNLTMIKLAELVGEDYWNRWGAVSRKKEFDGNNPRVNQEFYDVISEQSERFIGLVYELRLRSLTFFAGELENLQPNTLVDAACGCGLDLLFFARTFPQIQYIGYDISPGMISKARKRLAPADITNVSLFGGVTHEDIARQLTPGTIDVIYGQMLEYHDDRIPGRIFYNLLAPGGRLYVFKAYTVSNLVYFLTTLMAQRFTDLPRLYNLERLSPVSIKELEEMPPSDEEIFWGIVFQKPA